MKSLTKGMTIPPKRFLAVAFLFSSSFVWFYIFYTYLNELVSPGISSDSFWGNIGLVIFLVSIAIAAFVGSTISERVSRRKMLFSWLVLGVIVTVLVQFFRGNAFLVVWGIFAGLSFGVGFPSCQAFIADSTTPDERGRVAGYVILVTFILLAFSFLAISTLGLDSMGILWLAIVIKSIGFLSFALDSLGGVKKEREAKPWRRIIGYRDFYLYLIPYVLFMFAAGLVSLLWQGLPSDPAYVEVDRYASYFRYFLLSIFAVVAGSMADRMGRKTPIILGSIMLGASYALIGLLTSPETYFITLLMSACAWGIIIVLYLVVPGDLAFSGSTERFYTLGWLLPFILYTGVLGTGKIFNITPKTDVFAAILSIIIFASTLPLLYAAETLSESKLRERRLMEYAEKAGKLSKKNNETG